SAHAAQDFDLILQSPHVSTAMTMWNNVLFAPSRARYPLPLAAEGGRFDPAKRLRIIDDDSLVRLGVAPHSRGAALEFCGPTDDQPWHRLHVRLPATKGAHVDFLLPMVSAQRPVFEAEMALGYDAALAETRRYWRKITASPTRFEVPEKDINDCLRQS